MTTEIDAEGLAAALAPFAAAVFNDNGDVTLSTSHIVLGDYMRAYKAIAAWNRRASRSTSEAEPVADKPAGYLRQSGRLMLEEGTFATVYPNADHQTSIPVYLRPHPSPATSDEAVEQAARAISSHTYARVLPDMTDCEEWDQMHEADRKIYRVAARAALEAWKV